MNFFDLSRNTDEEKFWVNFFWSVLLPFGTLTLMIILLGIRCIQLNKMKVSPSQDTEVGHYLPRLPDEAPPPPAVIVSPASDGSQIV